MTTLEPAAARIDRDRVAALTERQRAIHRERTAGSGRMYERAAVVMPGGVPSAFQAGDPWPVYLDRGEGARVWDVDGNEYVDFHNGFGVMCVGHANPAIAAAVKVQMDRGTHFAAPTEGSITVAEELRRRWGLPHWRFTNSGTEATLDALHLARAASGRDVIVKIEGSYHGHHDSVMVSVKPPAELMGDRDRPASVPYGLGYPEALTDLTRVVPFNDADALERLLDELDGQVAGVIMEPAMMNVNIIPPVPGYLEKVRDLTAVRGVTLIFDEVKTGAAVAAGGATELYEREAGCRVPGEGHLRRPAGRRDRHERRAGRAGGRRPRAPAGHVQRQPAGDGGGRGDAHARSSPTTPTPACTPPTAR